MKLPILYFGLCKCTESMNFENKTHFEKKVANRSCARFISCCEKIEVTLLYTRCIHLVSFISNGSPERMVENLKTSTVVG